MHLRIVHWRVCDSINKFEHIIRADDPAFISGLAASHCGWSRDFNTIIEIYRKDNEQWSSLEGSRRLRAEKRECDEWTLIDDDEIYNKYLSFFLLDDDEHQTGDLCINYEDSINYYRGVDEHFMRGFKYFQANIDNNVKYSTC